MQKRASLKQINKRYHNSMKTLTRGSREHDILEALTNGKNSYLRMDRLESSSFDKSWIEEIENVIFDLGEIISNPRQTTKIEGSLVPVELARKTNAESVQHLASHTQYVKEIDEYGNVIPSKILTMVGEDDIHTYENRFIATFVRRLVLFVEKRYELVSNFAELHDDEVLYFKNKSFVDGATVEIETKIKISHKSDDELSLKSNAYVERIKQIRNYILYYYNSDFMKKLKTEKDVHNPILQTNIIRKNPKYHHCFEVYKFIEGYDQLGVNYKVDEHYSLFNDEELKEINRTLFANYITLHGKDRSKNAKTSSKVYKPKILTSMDDESFVYGPYLSGPISFVRVDEGYQNYLDSKVKKDLPLHPTKKEKEYYADEYAEKAENRQDLKQKNDLLKRKEKEVKAFNKAAAKIDEERELARLALLKLEQEVIKKEEDAMLEAARKELIAASLADQQELDEERARKEREFLDSIKPAVLPHEMSHPHTEPVTYDEAVAEIWPQSTKEVEHVFNEEQEPQRVDFGNEYIKPAVVPVPMSHPHSEPVTYEEAVEQIWPQTKDAPALRQEKEAEPQPVVAPVSSEPAEESNIEQQPVEQQPVLSEPQEQPVVEQKQDIKPAIVPVPMSHPHSEPVTYEQAVEQIWPQTKNAPILREAQPEEQKAAPVQENKDVQPTEQPVATETKENESQDIKPAVVPVEMSHPYSKPVSYDEAVEEIWPQLKEQPDGKKNEHVIQKADEESSVEEKVSPAQESNKEYKPEDIKPAVVPVEMSHPHSEPVSYDEAVVDIWPQLKNEPQAQKGETPVAQPVKEAKTEEKPKAKKVKKVAKPVDAPVETKEEPREIKPAVVPVEMSHPHSEPVSYDEAVEEIWPQVKDAPLYRKEESPVEASVEEKAESPVEEAPKAKKAAKKAKKGSKKEENKQEQPQPVEEQPVPVEEVAKESTPEVQPEEKVEEQPVEPQVEEQPVEQPAEPVLDEPKEKAKAKKNSKKPVVLPKKANKPAQKKQPAKKPAPKKEKVKREKIPGRFIVKTAQGYYISKNKFSIYKDEAKIFDDFNLANDIKKQLGGKVVKI